jgi:hypothetical protein
VKRLYLIALFFFSLVARSQDVEIKGSVRDYFGERLPLASVSIFPDSIATTSDLNGDYLMRVRPGPKTLKLSYTGYETLSVEAEISGDTLYNFVLVAKVDELDEVVVEGDRYSNNDIVQSTRAGTQTITRDQIGNLPSFMGQTDVLKIIQLLPGSVRGAEGSSDVFVRGGAADQNLVLLDGAPIYNTTYLFGFLSVFNPDIVDHVEAINGGFPAEFGGRLSSVMNVGTTSVMPKQTTVSGEIGLISSRLKLEQPILKDKASFWVTGRRTYVDQVLKAVDENLPYYFHDLNAKLLIRPTESNRIEVAHYSGEDVLDLFKDKNHDGKGMLTTYNSGNATESLKWAHFNPHGWRSNLSLFRTNFNYRIKNSFEDYAVSAFSAIEDYGAKIGISADSVWGDGTFTTGLEWTRHAISPNVINSRGSISEAVKSGSSQGKIANEFAAYVQQEWSVSRRLILNTGIRGSMATVDNRKYVFPEPRISARYNLTENSALKFNYSRMVQYMHRISNSGLSTPTDVWYPVTDNVRPQTSHQFSIAWQRFRPTDKMFFSLESYYKAMEDLIAYEAGTNLLLNSEFASRLIQGRGKSYGLEFLLRKDAGKFTGWISYTLSWSWRKYDQISNGDWFHARYDRRHNGAIVAQYAFARRWAASVIWEYISGARFTPVIGQYAIGAPSLAGVDLVPVFSEINGVKLSDSHRLDLGIKFFNNPDRKFRWNCFAGVYNAYNRASPIGIVIEEDEQGRLKYLQPGLFGLLPFFSYGFKL